MDELRHLFTLSASAVDRARAFRDDRITFFNRSGLRPLIGNGRFILHVFPLSTMSSTATIGAEKIYARRASFAPLGGNMGMSSRYNLDGVINEDGSDTNYAYTQIFRNGIVEAIKGNLIYTYMGVNRIAGQRLEGQIFASFARYIDGLNALNVEPPLILMLTLEGVEDALYHVYPNTFQDVLVPFDRNTIRLPECLIEEYSTNVADYHAALRPAFDALGNAVGFSKCRFFDETTSLWSGE